MVHMELLHHFMTFAGYVIYPAVDGQMKSAMMTIALREPFLMHSLLGLSAHHFSVVRPNQRAFYHHVAIQLQTRALSLFNSIDLGLLGDSTEKRIPVFMFSGVLGFHALCDMLSHRDSDWPSAQTRFVSYLRLHRGMLDVMEGHWESLRNTELSFILSDIAPQFHTVVRGQECDDLRQRIRSSSLTWEELEATEKALDHLQGVIDARPNPISRAHVLCSWTGMIGKPFARMLETGRPEALAVLAYYFLAIHYCHELWMMGSAGQHFLTLLVDHFRFGEWAAWFEVPYRMLQESLEKDAQTNDQSVPGNDNNSTTPAVAGPSHSTRPVD